jgi:futalosine hydrolase
MNILIASATSTEITPLISYLELNYNRKSFSEFNKDQIHIDILVTGVGSMMTAFALARYSKVKNTQLLIHSGIAGAFDRKLQLAEVVEIISERWADFGAEDATGNFIDCFSLGLLEKDRFPYENTVIHNKCKALHSRLPKVNGVTVQTVSGLQTTIDRLTHTFHADVESMEGMGLFYACKIMDIPFISLKSISNYVEPRNRSNWKLEEAVSSLNQYLISILEHDITKLSKH